MDDLVRFLRDMRQEFASWKDGLHPGLQIDPLKTDSLYLPHVMQLQYVHPIAVSELFSTC